MKKRILIPLLSIGAAILTIGGCDDNDIVLGDLMATTEAMDNTDTEALDLTDTNTAGNMDTDTLDNNDTDTLDNSDTDSEKTTNSHAAIPPTPQDSENGSPGDTATPNAQKNGTDTE